VGGYSEPRVAGAIAVGPVQDEQSLDCGVLVQSTQPHQFAWRVRTHVLVAIRVANKPVPIFGTGAQGSVVVPVLVCPRKPGCAEMVIT
jgi:hypothetical protein